MLSNSQKVLHTPQTATKVKQTKRPRKPRLGFPTSRSLQGSGITSKKQNKQNARPLRRKLQTRLTNTYNLSQQPSPLSLHTSSNWKAAFTSASFIKPKVLPEKREVLISGAVARLGLTWRDLRTREALVFWSSQVLTGKEGKQIRFWLWVSGQRLIYSFPVNNRASTVSLSQELGML